jgi:hypothetical protein
MSPDSRYTVRLDRASRLYVARFCGEVLGREHARRDAMALCHTPTAERTMKRNKYHITIDGKRVATKYAWNSAVREIGKQVLEITCALRVWEVSSHLTKADPWHYERGEFTWKDSEGNTYAVEITREEPEP